MQAEQAAAEQAGAERAPESAPTVVELTVANSTRVHRAGKGR